MRSSVTKIFSAATRKSLFFSFLFLFSFHLSFSQTFEVLSPAACAGTYEIGLPAFGPDYSQPGGGIDVCGNVVEGFPTIETNIVVALSSSDVNTSYICNAQLPVTNDISGTIAMVDRGDCQFQEKAQNCQDAGALMIIVCNRDDEVIAMGGENPNLVIPSVMLKLSDCVKLKAQMDSGVQIDVRYAQSQTSNTDNDFVTNPNPPANLLWSEDFSDGLAGWDAVAVLNEFQGVPEDSLSWTYNDNGSARWWQGTPGTEYEISTTGAFCNGVAEIDALFLSDTYGQGNEIIIADLISPSIDLGGIELIQLNFTQFTLPAEAVLSVSASGDDGATWTEPVEITSSNGGGTVDTEFISIPMIDFVPTSTSKIKFTYDGSGSVWHIDDIGISELSGTNANIVAASYWPSYHTFPLEHACADPFDFSAVVSNSGAETISSLTLTVEVTNETTGQVEYTGSTDWFLLDLGQSEVLTIEAGWVPTSTGLYSITHTVSVPNQPETNLLDNAAEVQFFEVTDQYYSTHGNAGLIFNSSFQWEEYGVGVVYGTCAGSSEVLASCMQVLIDSDDPITTMEGNYVTVDILRLTDGFNTLLEFDISNIELFGNPQLEIVHEFIYEFTADDVPGNVISIPFLEGGELFPLTPGETYMFYIHFDNFQFGDAEVANSGLGVGFMGDNNQSNNQFLRSVDEGQWFGGYASGGNPYMSVDLNECRVIEQGVPVELSKFTATANTVDISLDWATQSEVNNAGFEIERSLDGKDFSQIGFVGVNEANSNREKEYAYRDRNVQAGVAYYYRLKQVDIDGRFEYSGIVNATIEGTIPTTVSDFYPNPVSIHNLAQLTVTSDSDTDASYALYSQNGVQVANRKLQLTAGSNVVSIDKDGLATGMYIMKFKINNETFVKKMILID